MLIVQLNYTHRFDEVDGRVESRIAELEPPRTAQGPERAR
jgi:hypothetical protein